MATVKERFDAKYKVAGDCWEWTSGRDRNGYGRFRWGAAKIGAHRASFMLHKGEIPDGLLVMHSCDNRLCVNPAHLSVGTYGDNMRDMSSKGRHTHGAGCFAKRRTYEGENSPATKLTEEQAMSILSDKRKHWQIALDYGITRGAVSHLKRGLTWSHLQTEK